jgi:pyrophosphatase PpaX
MGVSEALRERNSRLADVDCVLFDLDGTLIDSVELILASFRHATAEVLGEALPDEVMMCNVGVPLRTQMAEFSPDHVDELLAAYREHNGRVHDELLGEYPGTEEALERLSEAGFAMGVVTSKSAPVARRGLERYGLQKFFGAVVAMEDTDRHKPEPDPLLRAAELLGYEAGRCAYVGDAPQDILAAKAAGMVSVGATWGAHAAEKVAGAEPDFLVHTALELSGLLGA